MPLSIETLRTLIAVAQTGSFTRAAERVFRTQGAVSIQMKSLEEFLGKSLFERGRRGAVLTEDGKALADYATRILALHKEALTLFHEPELSGTIRLGIPDDYAASVLPGQDRQIATTCLPLVPAWR